MSSNIQMEMMSSTDTAFKLFDKDKDGFITRAEFAKVACTKKNFFSWSLKLNDRSQRR